MRGFITSLIKRIVGNIDHDAADSGAPVKIGAKGISFGAVTTVAAGDRTDLYANRDGVLFVLGGHPNPEHAHVQSTASGSDTLKSTSVKIVVTELSAYADNANTGDVRVTFKLGTAIIAQHAGVAAGSGFTRGNGGGIIAVGGAGDNLTMDTDSTDTIDGHAAFFEVDA